MQVIVSKIENGYLVQVCGVMFVSGIPAGPLYCKTLDEVLGAVERMFERINQIKS